MTRRRRSDSMSSNSSVLSTRRSGGSVLCLSRSDIVNLSRGMIAIKWGVFAVVAASVFVEPGTSPRAPPG
jgi:hypothetical protein